MTAISHGYLKPRVLANLLTSKRQKYDLTWASNTVQVYAQVQRQIAWIFRSKLQEGQEKEGNNAVSACPSTEEQSHLLQLATWSY